MLLLFNFFCMKKSFRGKESLSFWRHVSFKTWKEFGSTSEDFQKLMKLNISNITETNMISYFDSKRLNIFIVNKKKEYGTSSFIRRLISNPAHLDVLTVYVLQHLSRSTWKSVDWFWSIFKTLLNPFPNNLQRKSASIPDCVLSSYTLFGETHLNLS